MTGKLARRALIAMTSHSSPFYDDGRVNGVYYTEASHPYQVLADAGFEIDIATETGTFVIDEQSKAAVFLNDRDVKALEDPSDPFTRLLAEGVLKASELDAAKYGMVFVAGGFASIYDFPTARGLQTVAEDVWRRGGIVAAVCHGGAIFPGVIDASTGKSIVSGLDVTGFSTAGDQKAGVLAKIREDGVMTAEESAVLAGANYRAPPEPYDNFVVSSGRLVTGANPASAHSAGVAAVAAFEAL